MTLTNDQIIRRAVKFIGDETCRRDVLLLLSVDARAKVKVLDDLQRNKDRRPLECWRALIEALGQMDAAEQTRQRASLSESKKDRIVLKRFEAALHRLRHELEKLPDQLRFPLLSTGFDEHCRVWLDICKKLRQERRSTKPKRSDGFRKRCAAEQALILLRKCRSDVEIRTVDDGRYRELAAVLYGKPDADLRRYCREQIKAYRTGAISTPVL
jgi:hypothetical protein